MRGGGLVKNEVNVPERACFCSDSEEEWIPVQVVCAATAICETRSDVNGHEYEVS